MRTLKLATITLLFFTLFSMVPGHSSANTTFTDVSPKNDFYNETNYLTGKGIISGYDDGTFRHKNNLTRAQAAKMLVIATGNKDIPTPDMVINNLKPGSEQYEFSSRAIHLGFFKIGSDRNFKPNEIINRDEMGYALSVAFGLSEKITASKPLAFPDMKNHKYAQQINGLYYAGVTAGDAGSFLPNSNLTRKHFVLFVARAMDSKYALPVKTPDQTAETSFVKVNTGSDTLNIRSTASDTSPILGKLHHGNIVEVIVSSGDWLRIRSNGTEGYIHAYFTVPADTAVEDVPPVKPDQPVVSSGLIGKVTAASLNVRSSASGTAPTIDKITRGQQVEVVNINGYWATIKYNSKTGFVHKSYLKLINKSNSPLKDRIIVIDAGHGGRDPGTSSRGLAEKTVALDVSKRVETKLKNAGAKVLMTRTGDTFPSLKNRTDFAKDNYAETFVSIHVNSATPSAKGTEVFYDTSGNPNGAESKSLATYIQNNIVKQANMTDRGVKNTGFYVVKNSNVAAVLVELGFITNADDFKKLSSPHYLEIYSEAIYQGLVQYYSSN